MGGDLIMQNNVSLACIVKNSEDVLDTFFLWAMDNFKEINVVVDDKNDDNTVGVAKYWADKSSSINLMIHPFDNFSSQKQRAYNMSTKEYSILIDADEILEDIPPNGIENFMNATKSDYGLLHRYNLQRDDEHYNRQGYPDTQLRVIRMSSGIRMNGKLVDETLGVSQNHKGNILPWHIIHYGHVRSINALKLKGKDRLVFADHDSCDGEKLKEHGEDWFIERNVIWNRDEYLSSLPNHIVEQSKKYWSNDE